MNKKIIWLGDPGDEQLLPILRQQNYELTFPDRVDRRDCLVCYAPGTGIEPDEIPADAPVIVYEPRSFTCNLSGHDVRFALLAELAQRAEAVVCCDEISWQWWSCLNPRVYLLGQEGKHLERNAKWLLLAQIIAADYLAGCSYAEKHRNSLWTKVKQYYKEFGLQRTLYRVYEKLSGQDDEN